MLHAAHDRRLVLERIVASEDRLVEAGAEVIPLDVGRVVRQRQYPHVFDTNMVRQARLDGVDLDRALDRLYRPLEEIGARHLQIAGGAAPLSDDVAIGLRQRGFLRERLLAMVAGQARRAAAPGVDVRAVPDEAPFGWYADTLDRMNQEEPWYTPALSREIVGALELKAALGALVMFVAVLDGRPAGAAALSHHAGVASITTVGTVPRARRRGVAQAMVLTLVERARRAGCDLVYLLARSDDTPKDMYRKLGFETMHGLDSWLRLP